MKRIAEELLMLAEEIESALEYKNYRHLHPETGFDSENEYRNNVKKRDKKKENQKGITKHNGKEKYNKNIQKFNGD